MKLILEDFCYINLFFYFLFLIFSWLNWSYIFQGFHFFYEQNKGCENLIDFVNSKGLRIHNFNRSLYTDLYKYYLDLFFNESVNNILSKKLIAEELFNKNSVKNSAKNRLFWHLLLSFLLYFAYFSACYLNFINFNNSYKDCFYYFLMIFPFFLFIILSNIFISANFRNKLRILKQNLDNFEFFIRKKITDSSK